MANNIRGITIEIDGNTTKLKDALKDVNAQIKTTNDEDHAPSVSTESKARSH